MEHDGGRAALWVCSALVGLLRHKGIVGDGELEWLARGLEEDAAGQRPDQRADMERAARFLRQSTPAAKD